MKSKHEKAREWATVFLDSIEKTCLEKVKLSIILPVFNNSERVSETFISLLGQGYSALEVILIDAGSTDRTLEIAGSFTEIEKRVYTVAEKNLPLMINRGVGLSQGKYLSILLPGCTYLYPEVLERFSYEAVTNKFPDLICGGVFHGGGGKDYQLFKGLSLDQSLLSYPLSGCWIKKEFFERAGKLDPTLTRYYELDFFLKSAKKNPTICAIDRVSIDQEISSFKLNQKLEIARVVNKYLGFFSSIQLMVDLFLTHLTQKIRRRG